MGGKIILKVACRLGLMVAISAAARGIVAGVQNLLDGKDILGRKKIVRKRTYQDWQGNIVCGTRDYQIC